MTSSRRPSVYEFAGGDPAFLALTAAHHERCLADPVLNHPFSHSGQPDHLQRLAYYWAEVFGGPRRYSESHGGQSEMLSIHAGTGAEDDMGDRFVACFMQAVDDAHLPDDPEFRAVLHSYMESAAADVMSVSPIGARVAPGLPIRRWSWDGPEDQPGR
jgi:hemoglobin